MNSVSSVYFRRSVQSSVDKIKQ